MTVPANKYECTCLMGQTTVPAIKYKCVTVCVIGQMTVPANKYKCMHKICALSPFMSQFSTSGIARNVIVQGSY